MSARLLRVCLAAALLSVLPWATPAAHGAATFTYPGAAPCDYTLQQCINKVPGGSTINIALARVDENLGIHDKALTLQAAPGYNPVIGGTLSRSFVINQFTGSRKVVLRDLTFENSLVNFYTGGGSGHSFELVSSKVIGRSSVRLDLRSPARAEVTDNLVVGTCFSITGNVSMSGGAAELRISRNTITAVDPDESCSGIALDFRGAGTAEALVDSNVIYSVAGCGCGSEAAVEVRTSESVTAEVRLNANTIDDSRGDGVVVVPPSGTSNLNFVLLNNSISNVADRPIEILMQNPDPDLTVSASHNNFFDSGSTALWGGYTVSNITTFDPSYTDAIGHNYRLLPSSSLRNAGIPLTAVMGTRDRDGNGRVNEAIVDIGAYEFGSQPQCTVWGTPASETLSGTVFDDIICGLGGDDQVLDAFDGNDVLKGGGGADHFDADGGKTTMLGGAGADTLIATDGVQGNDTINGGTGQDTCQADPNDTKKNCP